MAKKPEPNPEPKRFVLIRSKTEKVRCNAQSYWRIVGESQIMGETRIDAIDAVLFATLVKAYKDKAWKSHRHEDGELCFGGGWFIVGIDTPEGSFTYHYEDKDWDCFDCQELPVAKHWDGHREENVTRLMSLPDVRPVVLCRDCKWTKTDEMEDPAIYCEKWDRWEMPPDAFCYLGKHREAPDA